MLPHLSPANCGQLRLAEVGGYGLIGVHGQCAGGRHARAGAGPTHPGRARGRRGRQREQQCRRHSRSLEPVERLQLEPLPGIALRKFNFIDPLVPAVMVSQVLRQVYRHLSIGQLRARSYDLQEDQKGPKCVGIPTSRQTAAQADDGRPGIYRCTSWTEKGRMLLGVAV